MCGLSVYLSWQLVFILLQDVFTDGSPGEDPCQECDGCDCVIFREKFVLPNLKTFIDRLLKAHISLTTRYAWSFQSIRIRTSSCTNSRI